MCHENSHYAIDELKLIANRLIAFTNWIVTTKMPNSIVKMLG